MKHFYGTYKDSEKLSTLSRELSWSNNLAIFSRSKTMDEMEFYTLLAVNGRYSFRELERQINSGIFERTMLANTKLSAVVRELPQDTENVFRDSYALEFLNLPTPHSEKDLQHTLISSLKQFILENQKSSKINTSKDSITPSQLDIFHLLSQVVSKSN